MFFAYLSYIGAKKITMFTQETIRQLKEYTQKHRPISLLEIYEHSGNLPAEKVFEKNNDVFINIHTLEANSSTPQLHGHDFFEINYVISGSCIQQLENQEPLVLKSNSICIMNPNVRHNLRVETCNDLVLNLSMKKSLFTTTFFSLIEQHDYIGQFFLSYFLSMDKSSNYLLFNFLDTEKISDMMEAICHEYLDKKPYYAINLSCMLVLLFSEVVRSGTESLNKRQFPDKMSVQITALFNYLSVHYATATLNSTAEYFHYHPHYLSAFIKKNTGRTFSSILNEIKLFQATYYLLNTNMPIKTISEKLGFSQLCNFYDFIKKNLHTTPVQFRQANQEDSSTEKK